MASDPFNPDPRLSQFFGPKGPLAPQQPAFPDVPLPKNPPLPTPGDFEPKPDDRLISPMEKWLIKGGKSPEEAKEVTKNLEKNSKLTDRDSKDNFCEQCCFDWLVLKVYRKTKYVADGAGGWEASHGKNQKADIADGEWYATAGKFSMEICSDKEGTKVKQTLMTSDVVERGGPETSASGQTKMIPQGSYPLTGAARKHNSNDYSAAVGSSPLPGWNVMGGVAGRGIDFHSGGNFAYSVGCFILTDNPNRPYDGVTGSSMTNMRPFWGFQDGNSRETVIAALEHFRNFLKLKRLPVGTPWKCVNLIVQNPQQWEEKKIKFEMRGEKSKQKAQ